MVVPRRGRNAGGDWARLDPRRCMILLTNCFSPALEDQKKTATVQIFCQQSMTDRAGMRGRRTNKIVSTTDVAILLYETEHLEEDYPITTAPISCSSTVRYVSNAPFLDRSS